MPIVKSKLNENDKRLLRKLFEFSGYTTTISVNKYLKNTTLDGVRYILKKMVAGNYLKEIFFYSDSRRDAIVYQVKTKTCRLFNNPDSYFRKKHNDVYVIRALIKQHFLFEICEEFEDNIISDHERRVELLCEDIGFNKGMLPKKYNKDSFFIHVEECILDGRGIEGKKLYCNDEILFDFSRERLVFIYTDKYHVNPAAQLVTLINKYKPLMKEGRIKVDFLVVVDSELRKNIYKRIIEKNGFSCSNKTFQIPECIINLHLKILREGLGVEPEKLKGLSEKIKKKYSNVEEFEKEHVQGIPVEDIKREGIKLIENMADGILSESSDYKDKAEKVKIFFQKLYTLYAAGEFDLEDDFNVKVYNIRYKFSVN